MNAFSTMMECGVMASFEEFILVFFFFFNDTATTEIYTSSHTLSLHDALPISSPTTRCSCWSAPRTCSCRSEEHTSELQSRELISYAVFCLKKKKINKIKNYVKLFLNKKNYIKMI